MKRSASPTDEELKAAWPHLAYEVWMFAEVAALMGQRGKPDGTPASNAEIESLLVHTRVLCDFFSFFSPGMNRQPGALRQGDVLAQDYLGFAPDEGWGETLGDALEDVRRPIDTRVVHLSVKRTKVKASDEPWEFPAIIAAMSKVVAAFETQRRARGWAHLEPPLPAIGPTGPGSVPIPQPGITSGAAALGTTPAE